MSASPTVPQIYRRVLQLAKQFPSIKRDRLVQDIKDEFHENKVLTDPAQIRVKVNIALKGIQQLNQYVALDPNAQSWSIDMDKDPFGQNHPDRPQSLKP